MALLHRRAESPPHQRPGRAARRLLGRTRDSVENYRSVEDARGQLASRGESERQRFLARYGADKPGSATATWSATPRARRRSKHTFYDLEREASQFLSFSAVIKRITPAQMPVDRGLRNNPALPVQFICHVSLLGAGQEEQHLWAMADRIAFDGPWPTTETEDEVLGALSRSLFDGVAFDGGAPTDPPVQVHHFACHCDTTASVDDDHRLVLANLDASRIAIEMRGNLTG